MRAISAPPVAYAATAQRPSWRDLPPRVQGVVEERLGGPVVAASVAGAGFTRGFAAVLRTADGDSAFVKASSVDFLVESYRREAQITASLPAAVPAARPRWTASIDDWYILALDPIDGHVPALPWDPRELEAALDAWAVTASALASAAPALSLPSFADVVATDLTTWRDVVTHRAPLPAMPWYGRAQLDELAALESELTERIPGLRLSVPELPVPELPVRVLSVPGLMHRDLRLDNVLIDRAGAAWLCDWNFLCHGPAWFDTVTLLITAYASGLDASALFLGHPTCPDSGESALDSALAALAGFYLSWADRETEASPSAQPHRRWSGEVTLAWLADRRGWPAAAP